MHLAETSQSANKLRRHILEFQDCITAIEKCEKRTCYFNSTPHIPHH